MGVVVEGSGEGSRAQKAFNRVQDYILIVGCVFFSKYFLGSSLRFQP